MKTLSIRQPYAQLVVTGRKTIENRRFATSHRGWLLVHAALRADDELLRLARALAPEIAELPRGAVVGAAFVAEIDPELIVASQMPWVDEREHQWVFADAIRFERPIPWRGMPGLFDVPRARLPRAVRSQLS